MATVFKQLHDYYDKRYVLTTAKNTERQALVGSQLEGWDIEMLFGVDKSEVTKKGLIADGVYDETAAIKLDRSHKPMAEGHICCSLGHRLIYEDFLRSDSDKIIVFEDDVLVNSQHEGILEQVIENIPGDADLIYWGWIGNDTRPSGSTLKQMVYHVQHSLGLLTYNHTMINNLFPKPHNDWFAVAGKLFCSHAYSVTRKGAETLLKWNTPIVANADNAIMYATLNGDLKAYMSLTPLFSQASLDTNHAIRSLTEHG
jgi:glycosyl transferase family 25